MPDVTFESIQPLIVEESVSGDSILFVFQCPLSGVQVPSQHDFPKDQSTKGSMRKSFLRSMVTFAQTGIRTAGKMLFGKSKMGKMVTNMAKSGVKQA